MRHLAFVFAALLTCAALSPALAADSIETSSVVVPLADGWHEQAGSQPISAKGPGQELMELTLVRAGSTKSLDAAEKAGISAIMKAASGMKVVMPLKSFSMPNGTRVSEIVSQSQDGDRLLVGVSLRGPSAIVVATMEGPSASGSVLAKARGQLLSLRWK